VRHWSGYEGGVGTSTDWHVNVRDPDGIALEFLLPAAAAS
jgi:hypothetical protein